MFSWRKLFRDVFGGGSDLSDANPLPVDTSAGVQNEAIQNTESTTALIGAATFTGTSRDCLNYAEFTASCFADQVGTLYVENSLDGVTWRTHDTVAVAASTPVNRVYEVTMRYNRVRYLNGGVAQTVFELATMQRPMGG